MAGKGTRWAAGFFGLWLLLPGAARAGWLYDWCHCQKPSYHKLNYLVPEIDRIHAFHCRIPIYTYARDLHPDIPLHYRPVVWKCPPVPPGVYTSTNYPWYPVEDGRAGFLPPPAPAQPSASPGAQ